MSESIYYVYNDIERLRDEPHTVRVQCEEDIQVTEEVYRRPVFLLPSYRCCPSSSFFSSRVVGGFAFASWALDTIFSHMSSTVAGMKPPHHGPHPPN